MTAVLRLRSFKGGNNGCEAGEKVNSSSIRNASFHDSFGSSAEKSLPPFQSFCETELGIPHIETKIEDMPGYYIEAEEEYR